MQFNNYYNRVVKKFDDIESYQNADCPVSTIANVNFIPGDGVDTVQIINWTNEWNPDYLVAYEDSSIVSRWFVINSERTRGQQFKLGLHRDVVVDNYERIIEAPMFIEKGYCKYNTDPAVFNKENLTFNQIKVGEVPLSDNIGCAWLVAYFDASQSASDFESQFTDKNYRYYSANPDYTVTNLSDFELYDNRGTHNYFAGGFNCDNHFYFHGAKSNGNYPFKLDYKLNFDSNNGWQFNLITSTAEHAKYDYRFISNNYNENAFKNNITGKARSQFAGMLDAVIGNTWLSEYNIYSENDVNSKLISYNGRVIKESSTGKHYKIVVTKNINNDKDNTITIAKNSKIWNVFNNPTGNGYLPIYSLTEISLDSFTWKFKTNTFTVDFEEIESPQGTLKAETHKLSPNTNQMSDAPYCAIAFPYSDDILLFKHKDGVTRYTTPTVQLAAASFFQYALGTHCYDVQLLPYNPFGGSIFRDSNNAIDFNGTSSYVEFKNGSNNVVSVGYLFYNSNISGNIDKFPIEMPKTAEEVKVANECNSYRLCAPQYTNVYEVSPMMNYGVSNWRYDCTYKPYQSYIHVSPQFKGLFGNFQDQRGLIITGSFSIPQITDQWTEYVNTNKNYANIFERGIKNLEVQQKWERAEAITAAATGWIGSGTTGATAGGIVGGPVGAIVGGIGATAGSIAGGVTDVVKTIEMQKETLNYTKDLYGYNLGNIQASPDTLKTVSAFDANTRLFPFLEIFTCSGEEANMLRNKIKYNGMSIGRIGTIADFTDFQGRYVKGQLIRLEGSNNDSHELIALADELFKGVFI